MQRRCCTLSGFRMANTVSKPQTITPAPQAKSAGRASAGWYVLLVAMVLGCIAASVYSQKGGWLFGEADHFLVDHNDRDRPFLSKVLSPHSHDATQYQARELSHFFENLDARFIYWSVNHNAPHFYSIINFVFLAIISVAHFYYTTRYLRMDPWISILLIALFWTAPCIFFSGIYLRAAKVGAALMLFFLAWNMIRNTGYVNDGRKFLNPNTAAFKVFLCAQTFFLTLAMCWMDRQGYYIAGCFILTLIGFWLGPKIPFRVLLITSMAAALVVHTIYGKYIGPGLILKHTGFQVSFEYQKLPWSQFFDNFFKYIWQGIVLLLNNFRWYFGNFTGGLTLFVWAAICWMFSKPRVRRVDARPEPSLKSFLAILFAGWIALLVFMNALMALRHILLLDSDDSPGSPGGHFFDPKRASTLRDTDLGASPGAVGIGDFQSECPTRAQSSCSHWPPSGLYCRCSTFVKGSERAFKHTGGCRSHGKIRRRETLPHRRGLQRDSEESVGAPQYDRAGLYLQFPFLQLLAQHS